MNELELRLIIIDDNPAIHQDFIKVLSVNRQAEMLRSLEDEIFGGEESHYPASDSQPVGFPHFQFDTASQGQEGFEKIKQALAEGRPYALAFVDIRMPPGWDGVVTIQRIWEIDPDIQIVICSAYSDYSWEDMVKNLGTSDNLLVLKKPFDNVAVRQLACALTRKWLLAREAKENTQLLNKIVDDRTKLLKESLSLLRATIESSADGILVIDLENNIIDYNKKFISMWALPQSMVEKKNLEHILQRMLKNLQKPKHFYNKFHQLKYTETTRDIVTFKKEKVFECSSTPHRLNNAIVGRVWCFHDITEQSNLHNELEHQAGHDPLTNLPNRILLNDRLQIAIEDAHRNNKLFALFFLDLDRFKLVNDSLNHPAGDELLKIVSLRLSDILRKQDTLARIGGDEFVIIIPNLSKARQASVVADKILKVFELSFRVQGHELIIGASIGISIYPQDGKTADLLLCNADLAMYQAKEFGNQYRYYTASLNNLSKKRLKQELELRQAVINKEFFLVYQPQMQMSNNLVSSVEALLRWQHPKRGVILPMEFIPIAEETGLIVAIGEWVIDTVCKQIQQWHEQRFPYIRIAVNVTTQQLRQDNFADIIKAILKKYHVPAQYLELEITENVIITHRFILGMIKKLKKIGVNIVLDDFGTGNSSLGYLKQVHFDRLKIDKSFIEKIESSRIDEVIIKAIITMARSLNFEVLAEGVENQQQINFLFNQQCDGVQGFFLSKPLTAGDVVKFFAPPD